MFRGSYLLIVVLISLCASRVWAADNWHVGAGYTIFSEEIKATDGTSTATGLANYAGLLSHVGYSWFGKHWLYDVTGGLSTGKASLGPLGPISYPDSGRRTWTLSTVEGSARIRVNPRINFGLGMLIGYRSADWKSDQNPAVHVENMNKVIYAPEVVFQWFISRTLSLNQTLATPDFRGSTMWRWSVQVYL